MKLSIRPLDQVTSPNNYITTSVFTMEQGNAPLLVFRLVDLSLDTNSQNFNPGGRIFFPLFGQTDRGIVSTFAPSTPQVYAVSSGNTLTIVLTTVTWSSVPQPGDLLTIPTGSILAGTGNANVGNYTVLSATNTTITASTISNSVPPVNVGTAGTPVSFSATPPNDIKDFSYSSILSCTIVNVNTQMTISRWANQLFPQVDPSIWGLQIYPSDALALGGMNNISLYLNMQGYAIYGEAKNVLQVQPVLTTMSPQIPSSLNTPTGF